MMKRMYLLLAAMWLLTAGASAQKTCAILDQEPGMIEFEVDTDLPAPESKISFLEEKWLVSGVLEEFQIPSDQQNVLAHSFKDAKLINRGQDVMYQTFIFAFADHRPLVISPDMIWLLISQTFGRYVNENAEAMRPLFVNHEGKVDLVVQSKQDILHDKDYQWDELFNQFSTEIAKNTKGDVTETVTANFSTTTAVERIASQITLMEAMKKYFNYVELYVSCGIPSIILKGTPADWQEVEKKTAALDAYDMGWWTRELKPLLRQFTRAAEGKPDAKFWKNIVMEDRPDRLRGGGCSNEEPTEFDGWFLKFFPDTKTRTIPKTMKRGGSMASEMCRVSFKHVNINDVTGEIVETCDVELFAGFIGIEVDEKTGALTPHIGWLARKSDVNAEVAERFSQHSGMFIINEVPEALKGQKHIKQLNLNFYKNRVVVPDWVDSIEIDDLTISGNMTEPEAVKLRARFPKGKVNRTFFDRTFKIGQPSHYRLDSIYSRSDREEKRESYVYDTNGRISEIHATTYNRYNTETVKNKSVLEYDDRGFCTVINQYSLDSGVPQLVYKQEATYDEEGHMLTRKNYDNKNGRMFLQSERENEYDRRGNRILSILKEYPSLKNDYLNTSTFVERYEYTYDKKGNLLEERVFIKQKDGNYELASITRNKYDKQGKLVNKEYESKQRSYSYSTLHKYERTYQNGREVKRVETEESTSGQKPKHTTIHSSYDTYGNLVMTEREDPDFYYGTTAYFYDLATPVSRVIGYDAAKRPGMAIIGDNAWFLLSKVPETKYRFIMQQESIVETTLDRRSNGVVYYYSPCY